MHQATQSQGKKIQCIFKVCVWLGKTPSSQPCPCSPPLGSASISGAFPVIPPCSRRTGGGRWGQREGVQGQKGDTKGRAAAARWRGSAWIVGQLNQDAKLQLLNHNGPRTVCLPSPKSAEESLAGGTLLLPQLVPFHSGRMEKGFTRQHYGGSVICKRSAKSIPIISKDAA